MNTRFLETFVWLSRLQSFSRTAEKLNTSQPAISGRIAALEELLGVALYERNAKGFILTPAGRKILSQCESIVNLTSELRTLVSDDTALGRPIRIGAADVVSLTWLPRFLEAACATFGDYGFDVLTDSVVNLTTALQQDTLDIALIVDGIDDSHYANSPLCNYRLDWVAKPDLPGLHDGILSVEQVAQLPIILAPPMSVGYRWQVEYLKRHNPNFAEKVDRLRVSCGYSPATGIHMARQGYGLLPVPTLLVRPYVEAGELTIVNVREPFPYWSIVACYRTPPTIPVLTRLVELMQAVTKDYSNEHDSHVFWP